MNKLEENIEERNLLNVTALILRIRELTVSYESTCYESRKAALEKRITDEEKKIEIENKENELRRRYVNLPSSQRAMHLARYQELYEMQVISKIKNIEEQMQDDSDAGDSPESPIRQKFTKNELNELEELKSLIPEEIRNPGVIELQAEGERLHEEARKNTISGDIRVAKKCMALIQKAQNSLWTNDRKFLMPLGKRYPDLALKDRTINGFLKHLENYGYMLRREFEREFDMHLINAKGLNEWNESQMNDLLEFSVRVGEPFPLLDVTNWKRNPGELSDVVWGPKLKTY